MKGAAYDWRDGGLLMKTKVLIVDDHAWVRRSVQLLLERQPDMEIVGAAENGEQALVLAEAMEPDIVVMDIDMPGMTGIEATDRLRRSDINVRTIILSLHVSANLLRDAFQKGAWGYVLKPEAGADLPTAIRAVVGGEVFVSPLIPAELRPAT